MEPAVTKRALRAEYKALLSRCDMGVLVLDTSGRVLRENDLARRLFGGSGALTGRLLWDRVTLDELHQLFDGVCESGDARTQEVRLPAPGAGLLRVSVSRIKEKEPRRLLLLARDVTELRRLETIRRDFVANVSHELRTPLASIRAMAETLQDGALDDPAVAQHFLGTIIAETERLTRISEDLLILSNAESGQPAVARFDLSVLIEQVVQRFHPRAEKSDIGLTALVPSGLLVVASRDQIEQVIVNLFENAIKYTPAGGKVHVTAEHGPGGTVTHVCDTGIGIQPKNRARIFERFYRVDKARSRQSGGTGLGLSIVKHIVEAHGGTVTVESRFGHGSTFTFVLPDRATPAG